MVFGLGLVLFALGIGLTIALHEAGHMVTARAFGMRVRRFSVGFGPRIVSFRKGETEYALSLLPVGGFCDIAGMTAQDERLTEEERPHAMFSKPAWQRFIVMIGGIAVNAVLGFSILLGVAVTAGLPNLHPDVRPHVGELTCSADQNADGSYGSCQGVGPAGAAGVQVGDIVISLDGQAVGTFGELRELVIARPGDTVTLVVDRQGQQRSFDITLDTVQRINSQGEIVTAGSIGLSSAPVDTIVHYDAAQAVPATAEYSWYVAKSTVAAIVGLPAKVPGVIASIFGSQRAEDSPMSVVGASRVGGELAERHLWSAFFMMLASLNYFLALFNLIPLPPFDGGHIAIICYEKLRDFVRKLRGLAPVGPADYTRLMPITYAIAAVLMVFGALVIVADVVNPIRLFG